MFNVTAAPSLLMITPAEEYRLESMPQRMILAFGIITVSTLGIPGNALVVFAVFASRKLQTSTNAFVVNLALSDFISSAFVISHSVTLLGNDVRLSDHFICKLIGGVTYVTFGASIINLALIAVNRYFLITRRRTVYDKIYLRRNIAAMIIISWSYIVTVVALPPSLHFGALGYSHRYRVCTTDSEHRFSYHNELLRSLLIQIPCLVVILWCYASIYRFLKRNGSLMQAHCNEANTASRQDMSEHRDETLVQVTKNLFLVVCAYLCCVMPFAVNCVIPEAYAAIPWTAYLVVVNSCVNPFIYGFRHPQFNKIFKLILTCNWKSLPEPSAAIQAVTRDSAM